jgi:hypothetical protein
LRSGRSRRARAPGWRRWGSRWRQPHLLLRKPPASGSCGR